MHLRSRCLLFLLWALLLGTVAWAGITGSISGLVIDPSGAVVTGAQVIAIETRTGIRTETVTDSKGYYSFPTLPIGTYDVEVHQSGFKTFRQTNVVADANSAVKVDVTLQVGTTSENIEVHSDAVQVETQSTQMGEVITGTRRTTVPLNGRAYTDLLSLQPGVVPSAYGAQAPGMNDRSPSGGLNSGNQSVNGYTLAKCLDNSSGLQDSTIPFDPRLSRALCAFNVHQNFVASYNFNFEFEKLFHADHGFPNKLLAGWSLSGITTFATGLPITLSENDDNSLYGVTSAPVDVPQLSGSGQLFTGGGTTSKNPPSGLPYFNTGYFAPETLGVIGNANRRFFSGPGLNNWDMALLKNTNITESKMLQLRFEAFNVWNHAQFQNPSGLINSSLAS